MTRISTTFDRLKREGRKALVPFLMAGDPDTATTLDLMTRLPAAGADLIELGMPFSDPVADGPVIQAAGQRSLSRGMNLVQLLSLVRSFRGHDVTTPVILMGYYNPIHYYGTDRFVIEAAQAGVDGLIIVDLPPEEAHEVSTPAHAVGLDLIRLITPTTDASRLKVILNGAGGFLYYVSMTGITGAARQGPAASVGPAIAMVRGQTDLPLVVGFGVKTPADAAGFAALADGVVVGSVLVDTLREQGVAGVLEQVRALKAAL